MPLGFVNRCYRLARLFVTFFAGFFAAFLAALFTIFLTVLEGFLAPLEANFPAFRAFLVVFVAFLAVASPPVLAAPAARFARGAAPGLGCTAPRPARGRLNVRG